MRTAALILCVLTNFALVRIQGQQAFPQLKLVSVPGNEIISTGETFCICKIVSYSTDSKVQRTDAILAGSSPDRALSTKALLRNINFELQQAMVFFDSYKVISQYASPVDCHSLFAMLKSRHEDVSRYTVLLPSYGPK